MPKGGARARSGPPPDPNALRRDRDGDDWVILPAAGRKGAPPKWPLAKASAREAELWKQHWALPQAVEWERNHHHIEVALYVRRLAEAEQPNTAVNLSTLVRQLTDALGISEPGMRANRWRIGDPEVKAAAAPKAAASRSARDRFTVVQGG